MSDTVKSGEPKPRRAVKRGAARLAAVQALYQIDVTGTAADGVLGEFTRHRLDELGSDTDHTLFADIVRGAMERRGELDEMIGSVLAEGWTLARMDRVLRAILRAGTFELFARADIPPRVTITQYVGIAHAFFSGKEPGFVNGLLDRLANVDQRDLRIFQQISQILHRNRFDDGTRFGQHLLEAPFQHGVLPVIRISR